MTIRPGEVSDAEDLHDLGQDVVRATYGPISEAYAEHALASYWGIEHLRSSLGGLPHWVAESEDGALVGVANLGRLDGVPVMWKLYVRTDHHGQGVGSALLDAVVSGLGPQDRELRLSYVDGNQNAGSFYRAKGFTELGRTSSAGLPDEIWMRMEVPAGRSPH